MGRPADGLPGYGAEKLNCLRNRFDTDTFMIFGVPFLSIVHPVNFINKARLRAHGQKKQTFSYLWPWETRLCDTLQRVIK